MSVDIIGVGACSGASEALMQLLSALPSHAPPVVVTRHFADGSEPIEIAALEQRKKRALRCARDGQTLHPGDCYSAPSHAHLVLKRGHETDSIASFHQGPSVNRERPAIDVMFRSLAIGFGDRVAAILLSNQGVDGVFGLLEIKKAGGHVFVLETPRAIPRAPSERATRYGVINSAQSMAQICEQLAELIS